MDLVVKLTAQGGPLWNVWLAAHVERRLKRNEQLATDVRAAMAIMLENIGSLPLRCIGHLMLGASRILRTQAIALEEEAAEVHSQLKLSLAAGPGLRSVAGRREAAVTLRLPTPDEGMFYLGDGGDDLMMLEEPDFQEASLEASLLQGRRHVAPIELITLCPDHAVVPELPRLFGLEDPMEGEAFGAPSQEDQEAMEALSQATGSPTKRLKTDHNKTPSPEDVPPPLDFLLGAESGQRDALSPQLQGQDDLITPTPKKVARTINFDAPDDERFGADGRSPILARLFDLSPPKVEHPGTSKAAAAALAPLALVDPGHESAPPAKKPRTKKPRSWMDEQTQIPTSVYHNVDPITPGIKFEYGIFLPHRSIRLGMTTTFSDICELLEDTLRMAPAVAAKKRLARAAAALEEKEDAAAEGTREGASPASSSYATSARSRQGTPAAAAAFPGFVSTRSSPLPAFEYSSTGERFQKSPAGEPFVPMEVDEPPAPEEVIAPSPVRSQMSASRGGPSPMPNAIVMASPHAVSPFQGSGSARGWQPSPSLSVKNEVKLERFEEDRSAFAVIAAKQVLEIKQGLEHEPEDKEISFLDLCSNGSAEAGARRFLSLLTLHMDGVLELNQDEPYGDIQIRKGPDWDEWGAVRYQ